MSIIKDALKRTQEVHLGSTLVSVSNLELRPMDDAPQDKRRAKLTLTSVVYVSLLLTVLVLGVVLLRTINHRIYVKAAPPTQSEPVAAAAPGLSSATSLRTGERIMPAASATTAAAVLATEPTDAPAAEAEAAPPQPAPLRLQAIFFNPARPSAIVSGKTVFVGDRVNGFHVIRIQPNSATLVSGNETNVLMLK
jgi:hypothetical protein